MALAPGTRLGPYEILSAIGAGGMGEVYRARDAKLNRDVALKILPETFALDGDRNARFRREAQVLASLNHPHIAAIYGFEDSGTTHALVLELVEGPTLADRIAKGPISLDEALPTAKQIAEALEAAHEQGIIHRDLKPANIKLRDDGTVKVLDFGLAKALEPGGVMSASVSMSPTITSPAMMTGAGMILGTAAYMSPEQARGKIADKRSDIWAFGCVLYEMLTARRLFDAAEVSDTLALVLKKEPDWTALPASTPSAIHRLLRRCLTKDRGGRLPDIGSARLEIDEARSDRVGATVGAGVSTSGARAKRFTTVATAMLGAAVLSASGVWAVMRGRPARTPVARVLLGVEPAERLSALPIDVALGQGRPSRTAMTFAPDGSSLVFSAERAGRVQLYLRRFDQLEATAIAGTEGAANPFFSPDGQSVGFYADGALKRVSLNGGPVEQICKADIVYGASWAQGDRIVFGQRSGGLRQVSASGGASTVMTTLLDGEVSHRLPQILPDGQTVLFTVTRSAFPSWDADTLVVAQSVAGGSRKVLIEGGADARWVGAGHLVYLRRGTLMAVAFDPRRLDITGTPTAVVNDVMQAAAIQPVQLDTGAGQFAVSVSGSLVYATGGIFPQDRWSLVWVDRSGQSEPLHIPPGAYLAPRLSPDGKRIAFNSTNLDWDLWTYDLTRGIASQFAMEGDQNVPVWTPDGLHLIFSNIQNGTRGLFSISSDGSGRAEPLLVPTSGPRPQGELLFASSWTSDGRLAISYTGGPVTPNGGIWLLSPDGKGKPQLLTSGSEPAFSSDGRWLAYVQGVQRGQGQVYVQPYPEGRRDQVSTSYGAQPAWRRDGRELYYVENVSADGPLKVRMMAVPITTTPTFSAGRPQVLFEAPFRIDGPFRGYDVTPDGQRFLMVREVARPPVRVSQMVLVQNWAEELKQRVRTK